MDGSSVFDSINDYEVHTLKESIKEFINECNLRELSKTSKWLAELNHSLRDDRYNDCEIPETEIHLDDYEMYLMASSLVPIREYARASFHLKHGRTDRSRFLNFWCMYKTLEHNKPMDFTDMNAITKSNYYSCLEKLNTMLNEHLEAHPHDGYVHYVKGLVCVKLVKPNEAVKRFSSAVQNLPLLWEAWDELSCIVDDPLILSNMIRNEHLPNHWMREFFLVQIYVKLQMNDEAQRILNDMYLNKLLSNSHFVLSKFVGVYHNKREVMNALHVLERIHREDPYRMEDLDKYSNLLYANEMVKELAYLAHHVWDVNRYTPEACWVVADYFSIRGEHTKAAAYFQRAAKLNSNYMSALILRGHSFLEMNNSRSAITCYRDAITINPQDYRAWYGLGQTYEILKMHLYSVYYFKRAQLIRPDDSRMLIAMGENYEMMNKNGEAIRCYRRARNVGDLECIATTRLAKLYNELNEESEAVAAYKELINESTKMLIDSKITVDAYKYLAYYHLKREDFDEAFKYAQRYFHYGETKDEGKALLKEIATKHSSEESLI